MESKKIKTANDAPKRKSAFARFMRALFVEFWGLKIFCLAAAVFIWLAITLLW